MNISMPIQMDSPVDRTTFYKWSQIVEYLEDRFGKVTIAAWVENAMITEFTEDVLRIEVGSDCECEILKRRCLEHIQNALKELFDSNATVEIYADGN